MTTPIDIRDLSLDELTLHLKSIGEPGFRVEQIFEWIYKKNATSFSQMTNLSACLKEKLAQHFAFTPAVVVDTQVSEDGTSKFLFDLNDHEKVEAVIIPVETRTTACISTQVGCKFGCRFCASGVAGWKRNLSVAEIMTEVLHVKSACQTDRPLSHIVFMGIGEPLTILKYNKSWTSWQQFIFN